MSKTTNKPSFSHWLLAALLWGSSATASEFYDFTIVAQSGGVDSSGNTFNAFNGQAVSINDVGTIAFVATNNLGQSLYTADGTAAPTIISFSIPSSRTYASGVQINNSNQVIARDFVSGTSLIRVWEGNSPGTSTTVVRGSFSGGSPAFPTAYTSVFSHPTLSNVPPAATDPFVAFSALDIDLPQPDTVLATPGTLGTTNRFNFRDVQLDIPLRPMIADNGDVVARAGSQPTDPIRLYRNNLASFDVIADSGSFAALGRSPGVSDDGAIVVFYGDLTAAGAGTLNAANAAISYGAAGSPTLTPLTAGQGIFVSIDTTAGRIVIRLAGIGGNNVLDPGETFTDTNGNGVFDAGDTDIGPFAGFEVNERVAVNNTAQSQRGLTIAFLATDSAGNQGLYTTRLNIYGTGVGNFSNQQPGEFTVHPHALVVEQGDSLAGLGGTVTAVAIYDPLNNRDRGDVAFFVATSTGDQAVIRGRRQEVVFLDFDPVTNFTLGPSATGLFNGLGVAPGWFGNMDSVFAQLAPTRNDLNGAANLSLVQDAVVAAVQSAFDDVDPPNARDINIKVLGRVADATPTDGPFMRVYLGDGPHNSANNSGTAGIADSDLFNRDEGLRNNLFVYNFETPLILIDNIFRVNNQFFTTQAGAASNAVSLNQGGASAITRDQVINAIVSTVAHEVAHSMGLEHLSNALNTRIMNAFVSSPLSDGAAADELRTVQTFGNASLLLEPSEHTTHAHPAAPMENPGARLAFAAGSNTNATLLTRDPPSAAVQADGGRTAFRIGANAGLLSVNVVAAGIGILPNGDSHLKPELINLGAGDLSQLLDREILVRVDDQVFLFASTTGSGIDVVSVRPGFQGNVASIDVSSQLLLFTEPDIRGEVMNQGQPLQTSVDIYQVTGGVAQQLGTLGSPSAPALVTVPGVVGQPQATAETAIVTAGLIVGMVTTANDPVVPAGSVISQNPPANSQASAGSAVDLVVSLGPALVTVPSVTGQPQAAAEATIIAAGFSVGTITTANDPVVPAGAVISQNPPANSQAIAGSAVDLVVSLGPALVTVPSVTGQPQAAAEATIIAAGFSVGTITTANDPVVPVGAVISQNPPANSQAIAGSAVDLVVSLGPALATVPSVTGQQQAAAEATIIAAGFSVGTITTANDPVVPAGAVISQNPPANSQASAGSAVDLVVSIGPPGEAPDAPQGLEGRAKGSKVNLSWQPSTGTETYRVFRKLDSQSDFSELGQTSSSVFIDNLPGGTDFADYYVVAENRFGSSPPSASVQVAPSRRRSR